MTLLGGTFVKQYYEEKFAKLSNDKKENTCVNYGDLLDSKKRELERLKIKFRDERNAWNKQNYANARVEETLDLLEEKLSNIGKEKYFNCTVEHRQSNNELIVCLSDLHIGQAFDSFFGEYDFEVAIKRLRKYLDKVVEIGQLHGVNKVIVIGLGDQISGSIHKTVQITNKENVVEQIKYASGLISDFCYELSRNFETVQFYNVSGNHSRIDKKEDALHDERLDDLIGWIVGVKLKHVDNFEYIEIKNIDTGIAMIDCCGKIYVAVHGDYDPMTKTGVSDLSMMVGFVPYAILRGHMHFPAMSEINGVQVVQSGSLAGCGDQYTIEKRLKGKPSQTVLVCNEDGIECIYNVKL